MTLPPPIDPDVRALAEKLPPGWRASKPHKILVASCATVTIPGDDVERIAAMAWGYVREGRA